MKPLPGAELWCAPDSEYKDVFAGSVANLRWSLLALSEAPNVVKIDTGLLTGLTNASVVSLANTLSLRARYLGKCDLNERDYFQQLGGNERFAALLLQVTSSDKFPAARRVEEKYPAFALRGPPIVVVGGKRLPLHSAITQRLQSLREESGNSRTNPYVIAANQLLGERQAWDEREVKASGIIPADPKGPFYKRNLSEALSMIRSKDFLDLLEILRSYYSRVPAPPPGVPASVLQK